MDVLLVQSQQFLGMSLFANCYIVRICITSISPELKKKHSDPFSNDWVRRSTFWRREFKGIELTISAFLRFVSRWQWITHLVKIWCRLTHLPAKSNFIANPPLRCFVIAETKGKTGIEFELRLQKTYPGASKIVVYHLDSRGHQLWRHHGKNTFNWISHMQVCTFAIQWIVHFQTFIIISWHNVPQF